MSILDRIRACQVFDPTGYVPFTIATRPVGLIRKDFIANLTTWQNVLHLGKNEVSLADAYDRPQSRSKAMAEILDDLREKGLVPGWRDEPYAVCEKWGAPVLMEMERAAVPLFGIEGYGVHMNGFVRDGDRIKLWVARRSLTKPTGPGKLDQIVAGGLPAGVGVGDNLVKECAEEADIPTDIASRARPVGIVSYCTERAEGLRRDVLFNFDLELPASFEPRNTDGEVEEFFLWPVETVIDIIRETDDFKFNCAIIVIDFLVRQGMIGPDDPDYVEIIQGLNR